MQIADLIPLSTAISRAAGRGWYFAPTMDATPLRNASPTLRKPGPRFFYWSRGRLD